LGPQIYLAPPRILGWLRLCIGVFMAAENLLFVQFAVCDDEPQLAVSEQSTSCTL